MDYTNESGEMIATDSFTYVCNMDGSTVQVIDGKTLPHRCRIDLDAQMGRG